MKFQLVSSKPRIFASTSSPSTGRKFSFLFLSELLVNGTSPFDHRDPSVAQADFITGIDEGCKTDGRSVNQIASRHIGAIPDGGVVAARGVVREREGPNGGVVAARAVTQERIDAGGSVEEALGVVEEREGAAGGVVGARGGAEERLEAAGGVVETQGGIEERIGADGSVVGAQGVVEERLEAAGGVVGAQGGVEEA